MKSGLNKNLYFLHVIDCSSEGEGSLKFKDFAGILPRYVRDCTFGKNLIVKGKECQGSFPRSKTQILKVKVMQLSWTKCACNVICIGD